MGWPHIYGASEPESSEDEIAAVVPAVGAVLGMLAGVVGNVDTQDQFLSWEDSENSSRGDCQEVGKLCASQGEAVHVGELGKLVATVVEDIRVTVVKNIGFIVVRVGSTSMGLEIKLMPDCLPGGWTSYWSVERLGATVMFEMVVATKVVKVKKDQMVASALVGVVVKDSRKKIFCKVVILLLPSPDVAHSLPVAFCALADEPAVVGL